MKKILLAAMIAVVSFASVSAEAKQRRKPVDGQMMQQWSGPDWFGQWQGFSPALPPKSQSRFIRGRLICAVNVNAELAAQGIRGTGSAMARSFQSWGRRSGPVPGAVAVFSRGKRGGHVAIVDSVRADGTVIYRNPSARRQQWVVGPYHRRPIEFRTAT